MFVSFFFSGLIWMDVGRVWYHVVIFVAAATFTFFHRVWTCMYARMLAYMLHTQYTSNWHWCLINGTLLYTHTHTTHLRMCVYAALNHFSHILFSAVHTNWSPFLSWYFESLTLNGTEHDAIMNKVTCSVCIYTLIRFRLCLACVWIWPLLLWL